MTLLVTAVRDCSHSTTTWNFLIKLPSYSDDNNSNYDHYYYCDDDDDDDDDDTCMQNFRENNSATRITSEKSRRLRKQH